MSTNVQIIDDSLRLIGVIAETQVSSAEQGATALRLLNQFMETWSAEGIEVGYFAQTATTDTCPIPAWAERGVTNRLAKALLAIYPSAQLSADLLDDEQNGVAVIRRIVFYQNREALDMSHMGLGESSPSGSVSIGGGSGGDSGGTWI
jgi:hypothetical protein